MNKKKVLSIRRGGEEIMVPPLTFEFLLSNYDPMSCKISYLANPMKNSALTSFLIIAAVGSRLRSYPLCAAALILPCLFGSHAILPALTNTLFTVHPPLLYIFTGLTVRALLTSQRRVSILCAILWALSVAMGGFWSMQELSWGG